MTTAARRRWLIQNRERIRAQKAAYYQEHKDVIKARAQAWQKANPGRRHRDLAKQAAAQARYRAKDPERAARLNREAQARWRARQKAKKANVV